MNEKRTKFRCHMARAKRKKIGFQFSFDSWCKWWQNKLGDDWLSLRGSCNGQYVMARYNDKGPYHPNNVKCITTNENSREQVQNGTSTHGIRNGFAKLTEKQVIEIFHAKGCYHKIAANYDTTRSRVYRIKTKRVWKTLTASL